MRWLTRWKPQNSTHTHTDKVLLSSKQIGTVCFTKFLRFCVVAFCFCAFSFGASALTASYSCGSGRGTAPSSQTVYRNRTFTTRANTCTPPSGQEFVNWLVGGTNTTLNQSTSYTWSWTSSKTLTAQYRAVTYSLRYDCGDGGGTAPTDSNSPYNSGSSVRTLQNTCTAPSGKEFVYWTCGRTDVEAGESFTITENTTCTAQYRNQVVTYSVTYACGNGGGNAPTDPNSPYNSGSTVTTLSNTCTPPSGQTFDKWSCNGTDVNAGSTFTIRENTTCTALYAVSLTYSVTYACGSGGGNAPTDSNSPYNSGSTVTTLSNTCTPPSGKTFDKWSCNGTNVNAGSTFTISGNTTCTAQYMTAGVTINLTWDGGGTPASCTYGGTFVPPTPAPRTGYVFTGWKAYVPTTCGIDESRIFKFTEGYAYKSLDPAASDYNASTYGLTIPGEWAVLYEDGVLYGMANCNTTEGEYAVAVEIRTESSGQYCWCQITGFTSYREDEDYTSGPECTVRPVSSSWVFLTDYNGSSSFCASDCMYSCASSVYNSYGSIGNLAYVMFEVVGQ